MARRYDSTRRKKAAQQTRGDILQAALKLHWDGVTEFEPLAREAGCSLATVRKHFPTKEALYRSCTRAFVATMTMPDLEALSAIQDRSDRLRLSVSEICRVHEAMLGYAWHSAYNRRESPVLDAVMSDYEGLADAITNIVVADDQTKAPLVRGLLDFLAYRALRLSGDLSPHRVATELTTTILALFGVSGVRT
jgi:AcrR family transcriptional regulator